MTTKRGRSPRDFYPTPPEFTEVLLRVWQPDCDQIWEPAAGDGAMSDVLRSAGYTVVESDIETGTDFLTAETALAPAIVTNPPFSLTTDFALQALRLSGKVALLLGLHFLGGSARTDDLWLTHPPSRVVVIPERMKVATADGIDNSQFNHMWVIWDEDIDGTAIRWEHL